MHCIHPYKRRERTKTTAAVPPKQQSNSCLTRVRPHFTHAAQRLAAIPAPASWARSGARRSCAWRNTPRQQHYVLSALLVSIVLDSTIDQLNYRLALVTSTVHHCCWSTPFMSADCPPCLTLVPSPVLCGCLSPSSSRALTPPHPASNCQSSPSPTYPPPSPPLPCPLTCPA